MNFSLKLCSYFFSKSLYSLTSNGGERISISFFSRNEYASTYSSTPTADSAIIELAFLIKLFPNIKSKKSFKNLFFYELALRREHLQHI